MCTARVVRHPVYMPLRCVIVDDNPGLLEAATSLLEREGISVVGVTSSPEEAPSLVRELRPDVTLVDIDLGGESGFDLVARLAGAPEAERSNVILISAHSQRDFADLIATSSALGFVSKPDLSAKAIHALLEQHRENCRDGDANGPRGTR
jgi:DNA-binding NarL/FixJ family response regulator